MESGNMSINTEMTALADAIRNKSGVTGKLSIAAMTTAIGNIVINPGGGDSDIVFGYLDENNKFQAVDLSGDAPVKIGSPETIDQFTTYNIPALEYVPLKLALAPGENAAAVKFAIGFKNDKSTFNGTTYIRTQDNAEWRPWQFTSSADGLVYETINLNSQNRFVEVWCQVDSAAYKNTDCHFELSGQIMASGNAMSLIDYAKALTSANSDGPFVGLFRDCTSLLTPPELPATTLVYNCYQYMFYGCTSLVSAPELPATVLADSCYEFMFSNCNSLSIAPELPATTLAEQCYRHMFSDTNLTTAPSLPATTMEYECYSYMFAFCKNLTIAPELPAVTLAKGCYNGMFGYCPSLTTAPELPATELARYCYGGMFSECTSLTAAPELPATTMFDQCYSFMFSGCSSLTIAPELPATTLAGGCYNGMFKNCTSLKEIKVGFVDWQRQPDWPADPTPEWVLNVGSNGTFYKKSDLPEEYGTSRIPEGWTVINY